MASLLAAPADDASAQAPMNATPMARVVDLTREVMEDEDHPVLALTVATGATAVETDQTLEARLTMKAQSLGAGIDSGVQLFEMEPTLTVNGGAVVLQGGTLTPDANGTWTAVVLLDDGADAANSTFTLGTVTVRVTPVNDPPRFVLAELLLAATEDETVPPLTVATNATAVETNQTLTARLAMAAQTLGAGIGGTVQLFETAPAPTVNDENEVVLQGGTLTDNANGTWTAVVLLDDGRAMNGTVEIGTATIVVAPVNDPPGFTVVDAASLTMTVAEDSGALAMTVATSVDAGPLESQVVTAVSMFSPQVEGGNVTLWNELFSSTPVLGFNEDDRTAVLTARPRRDAYGVWTAVAVLDDGQDEHNLATIGTVTISVTSDDRDVEIELPTTRLDATGWQSRFPLATLRCMAGAGERREERPCQSFVCDTSPGALSDEELDEWLADDCADAADVVLPAGMSQRWRAARINLSGSATRTETDPRAHVYRVKPVLHIGADRVVPADSLIQVVVRTGALGPLPVEDPDTAAPVMARAAVLDGGAGDTTLPLSPLALPASGEMLAWTVTTRRGDAATQVWTLPNTLTLAHYSRHSDLSLTVRGSREVDVNEARIALALTRNGDPVAHALVGGQYGVRAEVEKYDAADAALEITASVRGADAPLPVRDVPLNGVEDTVVIELPPLLADSGVLVLSARMLGAGALPPVSVAYPIFDSGATEPMDPDADGVPGNDGRGVLAYGMQAESPTLRAAPEHQLRLGMHAALAASPTAIGARLARGEARLVAGPPGYADDGIYDFVAIPPPGAALARVVLELPAPPEVAVPRYYKYRDAAGWTPFVMTGGDAVYSAPTPCPAPDETLLASANDARLWSPGLARGHRCLLLLIGDRADGNDQDGMRNGQIADPGAVGVQQLSFGGTSSAGLWPMLFLAALAGCALARRRRRNCNAAGRARRG